MKRLLFIILVIPCAIPATADPKNTILVVESYHSEYQWDIDYKNGLAETIENQNKLMYFQLDTKRLPIFAHAEQAKLAMKVYSKVKPDLVILGDDNALKYLGPKLAITQTPVVFLGINNNIRNYFPNKPVTLTGVLERPSARRTIRTISRLITPSPDKILVLLDSGTTSGAVMTSTFQNKAGFKLFKTWIDVKTIHYWETWQHEILNAEINGYGAVVAGLYHTITDTNKNHINEEHIIRWTSKNTPVPPFAFWDFAVGKDKTIGGLVQSGEEHGQLAGDMANRILNGESPSDISVVIAHKGRYLFSRKQLTRFGIRLPKSIASQAEFTN